METPDKHQGFNSIPIPLNFSPLPGTLFNDAVLKISKLSFIEVHDMNHWSELFPYPAFESTLRRSIFVAGGYWGKGENEQRLEWERDGSRFFDNCKDKIHWQIGRLTHEFSQNLALLAKRGEGINVDPKYLASSWCGSNSMSIAEFYQLNISAKLVKTFFIEFTKKWEEDRGLTENKKTKTQFQSFVDLFKKSEDIKLCVDVLNNYENSRSRKGALKQSVVIAWTDYLYGIGKIHTNEYSLLVTVLINEFEGFSIGRRTFYERPTIYVEAKKYFTINIPR